MSLPHDLVTHFKQYFEIVRADTPDLLEQSFRLRYQVYCQEGLLPGFDPLDYPDGLERDIYDYEHRSAHRLLRHRPTGSNAGTVRLVLADPVQPDALFPIEVAAGEQIDRDYLGKYCAARGSSSLPRPASRRSVRPSGQVASEEEMRARVAGISGEAAVVVGSEEEMRAKVAGTVGAIGYLTRKMIDESVTVLPVE